MARNGSGVYSLPGTYLAVSGETIEAQQHNDPLEDIESDANTARPVVAGGTGATTAGDARTNLAVPGTGTVNTFTKTQIWSKGVDVASGNALTLGTDGNYFDITGTTAITSIGTLGAGTVVRLHFDGTLTLTHDATALVLPGGADITTAAGDEAEFVEYATGDWRCVSYQKASGYPVTVPQYGQCQLVYTDNTHVTLNRKNGSLINIDGLPYVIPSAGVAVTNAGLSSNTVYYVYAYMNSGTMTLEISATGHSTHTDGTEIKTGDSSRTLVGMVRTNASSQFSDTASSRLVRSWFNRKAVSLLGSSSNTSFSFTSADEITTSVRVGFLAWGDESAVIHTTGYGFNSTAGNTTNIFAALDGTTNVGQVASAHSASNNYQYPMASSFSATPSEGYHYAALCGYVSGGTATVVAQIVGRIG